MNETHSIKTFDKNGAVGLWEEYEGKFKGEVVAGIVLTLSDKYIGQKAIDIGAGSGALLQAFIRRYGSRKSIIGLDFAPKHERIQKGDCTNLVYGDGSFDTIFCTDVIEHLTDDNLDKALKEAHRVLSDGGYGIFSTLNNEDFSANIVACPECGSKFHRWGHVQTFNRQKIRDLFAAHGFKVVEIKTLNLGFLATIKWPARIFYSLHLEHIFKNELFTSDLFFIVQKTSER